MPNLSAIGDAFLYGSGNDANSILMRGRAMIGLLGVALGLLIFLWARDGMSQAELSRVVAIEPPTMVRTIDRMVRDGLVTRVPDPDDGRVTRIRLTERGRSLRDELVPKATAVNARNLNRITEREGRTLKRLLAKLLVEPDR